MNQFSFRAAGTQLRTCKSRLIFALNYCSKLTVQVDYAGSRKTGFLAIQWFAPLEK